MTGRYDETGAGGPDEPLVVRDRRRIDPTTGHVRKPRPTPAAPAPEAEQPETPVGSGGPSTGPSLGDSLVDDAVSVPDPFPEIEKELAERTADLQRVQAEYANYRKRVERDRIGVVSSAKASVVNDLLPLLDDLERADRHGDLTGAFKAVADKLESSLRHCGLESFGTEGESFDPSVHEAVQHDTSTEVGGPTVTTVMRRGYKFGDRVLRPALVGVTDQETDAASTDPPVEGELPIDVEPITAEQPPR